MNDVKVNIIYMLDELNTKIKKFHTIEDAVEYIRSEYKLEACGASRLRGR